MKASDRLKKAAAKDLGILPIIEEEGWQNVTSRDAGKITGELVSRGIETLLDEDQKIGFEVAKELGIEDLFLSGRGWRDFTAKQMYAFAERLAAKRQENP